MKPVQAVAKWAMVKSAYSAGDMEEETWGLITNLKKQIHNLKNQIARSPQNLIIKAL